MFLLWLPWVLCMSRPGRKITRKQLMISSRMKELELKERSSKSLLANVLDIDDDFRRSHVGVPPNSAGFMRTASTLEDQSSASPACPVAARDLQVFFFVVPVLSLVIVNNCSHIIFLFIGHTTGAAVYHESHEEERRGDGSHERLEIRSNGCGSILPHHLHRLHYNRHGCRSPVGATHYSSMI